MGTVDVPDHAEYGAQTERARRNFQISDLRFPRSFLRALGLIKQAAAEVNVSLGRLAPEIGQAIADASRRVADGEFDDQFVVDLFQTGSGTSTNMNANEVIASLANQALRGGPRGGKAPVHPNDAVNLGQSSNDVIPTATHVAALERLERALIPALLDLQDLLEERARRTEEHT
ncbi:MAG: lyase family protein, partial [Isosphaeraceae bacterium]